MAKDLNLIHEVIFISTRITVRENVGLSIYLICTKLVFGSRSLQGANTAPKTPLLAGRRIPCPITTPECLCLILGVLEALSKLPHILG